jgi:ferritin-like metal-binding protein YciE
MALFGTEFKSFEDLFEQQLEDLYDAEHRIVDALPKMADAANSTELKQAFTEHLYQTQQQIERLERIFSSLGKEPKRETCQAMKGIIAEGEQIVKADADPDVKDAGLIAAAQRVEHYEIAGYGSARSFAQRLGHADAAGLLQTTLNEEAKTDKLLTSIAESSVNLHAMHK